MFRCWRSSSFQWSSALCWKLWEKIHYQIGLPPSPKKRIKCTAAGILINKLKTKFWTILKLLELLELCKRLVCKKIQDELWKNNHGFLNIALFQGIRPGWLWTFTSDTRDKRIVPVHHQVTWFDHIVHIPHIRKDKQSKSKVFKSPTNACTWIKNGFATMLAHGWQSTQPRESTRALKPRAEVTRSPKQGCQ